MRIMDNNPINEPAIGKLITTAEPIVQLEENRLYLLASASDEARNETTKVFEHFLSISEMQNGYINSYSFTALDDELFTSQKEVKEAIKKDGFDLIMLLKRPGKADYQYFLAKADAGNMFEIVSLMLYTAERVTKFYSEKVLHEAALDSPEDFQKKIEPAFSNTTFIKNFVTSAVHTLYQPSFGMVPSLPRIKDILEIKNDVIDFRQKNDMTKRIVENVNKVRKYNDPKADAELTYLFSSLPPELIIEMLKSMSPSQLKKSAMLLDPAVYAENSPLQIEICKPEDKSGYKIPDNKKLKNDGVYQLFLNKGAKSEHIHFKHKSSFVVYLIYLIDRYKNGNKVTPIDIFDKEKEYQDLYKAVYPHDEDAYKSFYTLVSDYKEGTKEKRQARMSDCFSEIRFAIGNACEKLKEKATPHIIENVGGHLYTRPNAINVSYDLVRMTG